MIVGQILVGMVLGGATSFGALLLGSSIWTALLIYAAIGAASVLGLAVIVALRDPQGCANEVDPFALASSRRG